MYSMKEVPDVSDGTTQTDPILLSVVIEHPGGELSCSNPE
jgi:hypothetical protein